MADIFISVSADGRYEDNHLLIGNPIVSARLDSTDFEPASSEEWAGPALVLPPSPRQANRLVVITTEVEIEVKLASSESGEDQEEGVPFVVPAAAGGLTTYTVIAGYWQRYVFVRPV